MATPPGGVRLCPHLPGRQAAGSRGTFVRAALLCALTAISAGDHLRLTRELGRIAPTAQPPHGPGLDVCGLTVAFIQASVSAARGLR